MSRVSLASLAMGAAMCAAGCAGAGEYVIVEAENPAFRPNKLFDGLEDLGSPRFKGLREKYGLDEAVKGEKDEFKRILLLRHWLKKHVVIDRNRPAVEGDALKMLEESPKGGAYHCGHFDRMQNAVLNAMGHVARIIFAGAGEREKPLSGSHGLDEVWVNSLCKWVAVDAEHDSHFEKDGVPLSALEIRREVWRDGAKGVFRHEGPERRRMPRERDDTWGRTPRTYAWVSWFRYSDQHTSWPKGREPNHNFVIDDQQWQTKTWYRSGKKHWAYAAKYFRPVKDEALIYWTPNVLKVTAEVRGQSVDVAIESDTPNLREYQISEGGAEWRPTDKSFTLKLAEPRHEWRLRSMNVAGVAGPEHRLVIERR